MQWTDLDLFLRRLSSDDRTRIHDAYKLGEQKHDGQKRRSGEDYFSHPVAVAAILAEMQADPDTIVAALLHDTVEDTDLTLHEIRDLFGPTVAHLIEGVTKLSADELEEKSTLNEQIETLRKMFTLMQDDIRIMVIKLFDRLHNMQTVSFLSEKSQQALARETMEVYVKIADRLCMQDLRDELEGLCRAVLEPDLYKDLYHLKRLNCQNGKQKVLSIKTRIDGSAFSHLLEKITPLFENKTWDQLYAQRETNGAVSGNADITCVFVCDSLDTCYQTLGMLHQLWLRESMSFQDFINAPAINGYQGLHTTVILEDGTRVRCKIRTAHMHAYARQGIATVCFSNERSRLAEILPWTQNISSLSADTAGRSNDFWESLQSDILGESILIHGPADEKVLLPKQSTALDGVFYLFHDDALRLESIRLNGKQATFATPLTHGITIDVTLATKPTVTRQWLDWTKTGMATAEIRKAISSSQTREQKIEIGKNLLQRIMHEKKRGFIEEFAENSLLSKVSFATMDEVYVAIADGSLQVADAFMALFASSKKISKRKKICLLTYTINITDSHQVDAINAIFQRQGDSLLEIRSRHEPGTAFNTVTSKLSLLTAEQKKLISELEKAGAENVEIIIRTKREILLLAIIILLWAANPVFARWFLFHGMTTLPLITLRLFTLSIFNIGFFAVWRLKHRTALSRPSNLPAIASLPSIGMIGMTVTNYIALVTVPPSVHLSIQRLNSLITTIIGLSRRKIAIARPLSIFFIILILSIAGFVWAIGRYIEAGIIFSVLLMLFYVLTSLSTESALQHNKLDIRQPYLSFQIGIFLGLAAIILIPFQALSGLLNHLTLPAIFFVILCVAIPHACHSALLKTARFKYFTDALLLEIPIAILLESLLLGIILPISAYIIMGLLLATLIYLRRRFIMLPIEASL
ncbi:MAG: HD domain-containing protein [Candidatus Peribacteraceae bacterium]|nr:HD domain-containing protein [Candidatus Peribacteraceae bacterium]